MLRISDEITIEDWELTEQFMRASGPGGQNVNKVATAVELRFEAARGVTSRSLSHSCRYWAVKDADVAACLRGKPALRGSQRSPALNGASWA